MNTTSDMIRKIYVINLDRRQDKWNRFLQNHRGRDDGLLTRFSAIDGSQSFSSVESLVERYQGIGKFQPSIFREEEVTNTSRYRAKLACWLSHWTLLKNESSGEHDKHEWIVILEDDVQIQYSRAMLECFLRDTIAKHDNPDIVVIGNRIGIAGQNIPSRHYQQYFEKNGHYGCESYAVHAPSIGKYLSYLHLSCVQRKCSIDNRLADLNRGIIKIVPLEGPPFTLCLDPRSENSDIEI